MNVLERYTKVFSFFKVKDSLIIIKRDETKGEQISQILGSQKKMRTKYLRHCGDYLYDFDIDKIPIYDSEFNYLYHVSQKGVSFNNTSVVFINKEILILSQSIWDGNDNIVSHYSYYEYLNKKQEGIYCGSFLSDKFRINGEFVPNGRLYFDRIGKREIIEDTPVFDYFHLENYDKQQYWERCLQDVHGFIGVGSIITGW